MASTYSSNLKIELIGTGEQAGLWGVTTNDNFTNVFEQAIVGRGTASFTVDADLTLTFTDSVGSQTARNLYLNAISTVSLTLTRNLIVPTINKTYVVQNNTTGSQSIVVKTAAGTGITIPNGFACSLYVNGTDVIQSSNYVPVERIGTLTLTNALAASSGGTGQSSYTTGDLLYATGTTALSKLPIGTNGQALVVSGGNVAWGTPSATTGSALTITTSGGASAPATFNGSSPVTIDYSTVGADQAGTAVALSIALG
jgi:hypothetical protein